MKKLFLATLLAAFAGMIHAQVPNGSFENWTNLIGTTTKNPNNFMSSNLAVYAGAAPSVLETTGVAGKGAELISQMVIDEDNGDTTYESGFLLSGEFNLMTGEMNEKFPVSGKVLKLKGHYNYQPLGGDEFSIALVLYKEGVLIGTAVVSDTAASQGYQSFDVEVDYTMAGTPDSASLSIIASSGQVTAGTKLSVDEFSFEMETPNGIETATDLALLCYPNPANSYVEVSVPEEIKTGTYTLVNAQGQIIKTGDLYQGNRLRIETSELREGVYFFQLNSGEKINKSKIVIAH